MQQETKPCVAPCAQCSRETSPTTADRIADSLGRIADALEALVTTAKEKETLPPTPPIREKESACVETPACAREDETLSCKGMRIPSLDEVKRFAAQNAIDADTAEDFWLNCDATGWTYKGSTILKWRSMLKSWSRSRKRNAVRDEKRQAHIDAKMDEREAKRASRPSASGRRKADNWVGSTEEQRKGLEDAFRV